eukprot:1476801-Pleurochrysis_carterae.AAC.1
MSNTSRITRSALRRHADGSRACVTSLGGGMQFHAHKASFLEIPALVHAHLVELRPCEPRQEPHDAGLTRARISADDAHPPHFDARQK